MNKGLVAFNIILLIAVAILFYLHFKKDSTTVKTVSKNNTSDSASNNFDGSFRIAYFEMDSLDQNFFMMKDIRDSLNRKEDLIEKEMTRLQKDYQDKYMQYQSQGANMTQAQQEMAGRDLMDRQGKIKDRQQVLRDDYQDFFARKQNEIKLLIEDYLKDYNKTKGYSYIFSYEPGFIYYKDSMYNITGDLVKGLNDTYKKKKGKKD